MHTGLTHQQHRRLRPAPLRAAGRASMPACQQAVEHQAARPPADIMPSEPVTLCAIRANEDPSLARVLGSALLG